MIFLFPINFQLYPIVRAYATKGTANQTRMCLQIINAIGLGQTIWLHKENAKIEGIGIVCLDTDKGTNIDRRNTTHKTKDWTTTPTIKI